jgi:purine-nucleoside phosphorylase
VRGVDVAVNAVEVAAAAAAVRARCSEFPAVAIVLGSGLAPFADTVAAPVEMACGEIPFWPTPAVPGHAGRVVVGRVRNRSVAVLAGRTHLYEGGGVQAAVFAIRVLARLGVRTLVLTNASGGIAPAFTRGTVVVIDDHINLTGANPLVGVHDEGGRSRFVDMSDAYTPRLRDIADAAAVALHRHVVHGVYAGLLGPTYETPAEVRALRAMGADLVGVSMVLETIAARYLGLEVLGLSLVTNPAAGVGGGTLHHRDVLAAGREGGTTMFPLLEEIVERL